MNRFGWVTLTAFLLVLATSTPVQGAASTTDSFLHLVSDDFVANDTVNMTLSIGDQSGGRDVGVDSIDDVNVFLCDSDPGGGQGTENVGRCWNGTALVEGNTDSFSSSQVWLEKVDAFEGCEDTVNRCQFLDEPLPDEAGETFTLDVRVQATEGVSTLFLHGDRFVTFEDNPENTTGVTTHDHNFSALSEGETNDLLLWGSIMVVSLYFGWWAPAFTSTFMGVLGVFINNEPEVMAFQSAALWTVMAFWLQYLVLKFQGLRKGGSFIQVFTRGG